MCRHKQGGSILPSDLSPVIHWVHDAELKRAAEQGYTSTSRINHNVGVKLIQTLYFIYIQYWFTAQSLPCFFFYFKGMSLHASLLTQHNKIRVTNSRCTLTVYFCAFYFKCFKAKSVILLIRGENKERKSSFIPNYDLKGITPTLMCLKCKQQQSENWNSHPLINKYVIRTLNVPLEIISFMGPIYFHFTLTLKQ